MHGAADTPVTAVVVGGRANGLGVVRSLSLGRVSSAVVDTTFWCPALWSRWSKGVRVDALCGRVFVNRLIALRQELGGRPVLILTDEMAVDTVSELRAELAPHYRIRLPAPAMVTTLGNKGLFHRLAEQHGLPVPRTVIIAQDRIVPDFSTLGLPVIVKPAEKRAVHLQEVERVQRLRTRDEAEAACRRVMKVAGDVIVQEWVEGPDTSIYFALFHCARSPAAKSIFFGRKIAAHPPGLGSTAVCVPAPEAAEALLTVTEKFLDISEYEGLGSLEFKWDAQSRRFVIIEPTVGRTDWQEEIATLNGMNIPLIAYRYELGLPAPLEPLHVPTAWRESFRHIARTSDLDPGMPVYDGYWRMDDPVPGFLFYAESVLRLARAKLRRPMQQKRKARFASAG